LKPRSPRLAAATARLDARIDWERRERRGMRVDTAPARDLLARLGGPERAWRAVHVGGSKGKGSVAALVAAGLERAGIATGIYASPHVERVTERVRVRGREVDEDVLAEALEAALGAAEAAHAEGTAAASASWFDIMTAAAFRVFAREGVEFAVVEVGLGGRLDSTNVLGAEVCIVTSIELEHTALLGSTRAAIAGEKAGIVHAGSTLVCGVPVADEAGRVLAERARAVGAAFVEVAPEGTIGARNAALAGAALDALGRRGVRPSGRAPLGGELLDAATRAAAALPGRLERRALGGVPVVLDGAHVASSLERVLSDLAADPALPGRPEVVLALARDKDAAAILKIVRSATERVHCTTVDSGIHLSTAVLAEAARAAGLDAVEAGDAVAAVAGARALAAAGGWVLVTGSLYLVGAVRAGLDEVRAQDTPCSPSAPTSS
jgi:dihydrofolate synthase/folylpolyglutamate synthase